MLDLPCTRPTPEPSASPWIAVPERVGTFYTDVGKASLSTRRIGAAGDYGEQASAFVARDLGATFLDARLAV